MKTPLWISVIGLALAGAFRVTAADAEGAPLSVGVSAVDITPDEPIRLSGYRTRREPAGKADGRLWAKALAIGTDAQEPAVLITVNLVGVPRSLTDRVAKRLRLDRARLAVCATHTHSGPVVKGVLPHIFGIPVPPEHQRVIDRYAARLEEKLVRVAREALAARQPARLSWSQGRTGFAQNRRLGYLLRKYGKDKKLPAPVDHALPALFVRNLDGGLRAVLLNYACHCTTLTGQHNRFHGDWAGVAARVIQERHPGATALVAIGCGADQSPGPRGTLDLAEKHGRAIADEIDRMIAAPAKPLSTVPACRYGYADLPFSNLPTEADLQERLKSRVERVRYYVGILRDRMARGIQPPASLEYPVQTWTFGDDLAMVFLAGEVVVDYSLRLKRELDGARLWVNAYANDAPCYIASARVIGEGGYEVDQSMDSYDKPTSFDPAVEDRIITRVRRLLPPAFAPDNR